METEEIIKELDKTSWRYLRPPVINGSPAREVLGWVAAYQNYGDYLRLDLECNPPPEEDFPNSWSILDKLYFPHPQFNAELAKYGITLPDDYARHFPEVPRRVVLQLQRNDQGPLGEGFAPIYWKVWRVDLLPGETRADPDALGDWADKIIGDVLGSV